MPGVFQDVREQMVREQIEARGIRNPTVLAAMRKTPRHLFVPASMQEAAYEDHPLSIGHGQTISQPFIVAIMTELLDLKPDAVVLEIGTGSGYQAAVLAALGLCGGARRKARAVCVSGALGLLKGGHRDSAARFVF